MHYGFAMSHQIQVKGVTDEIKERLAASAKRNFRSLNQEALARIQFSFEIEDSLRSKTLQKMIDEGLAGKERPGTLTRLREIAAKARAAAK
jgi:TraY domain